MSWLELLDERGRLAGRRPADALPCTIGHEVTNALVSRAPGVAARHAEVSAGDGGAIVVRDLGSEAGLRTAPSGPRLDLAELEPGGELLIGEARLRLVAEPAERSVPPAPLERESAPWSDRRAVKVGAPLVLFVAGTLLGWLMSADDDPLTAGLVVGAAVVAAECVWAGGWALVNRLRYGRSRFGQHFAVGVLGSTAAIAFGEVASWADFLGPDGSVATAVSFVCLTLIWLIALRLHLRVMVPGGTVAGRRLTAVAALLFGGCFAWAPRLGEDDFTAQVEYAVQLKPLPAALLPPLSADAFARDLRELEQELLADRDSLTAIRR